MDTFVFAVLLGLLGLSVGSFAGATVWRIRARQLVDDKKAGESVDKQEYKTLLPLTKATLSSDRSRCLHCGHQLAWYDLLPLVSWLSTDGKCRYCHKPIGNFEPLIELGTAAFFVASYLLWPTPLDAPLQIFQFVLWLIASGMLVILFAYDLKWFLLPDKVMVPLVAVAAVIATTHILTGSMDIPASLMNLLGAVMILSGLYLALWFLSKGQWIGFGDVKLGLALALLVGDWASAFIALFFANIIGVIIVLPGLLMGKISRQTRVPFGPLLILGGVIAVLLGRVLVEWYTSLLYGGFSLFGL